MSEKPAILISAYQNFDVLYFLLEYYQQHYCCYIHVDKKVTIPKDFIDRTSKLNNVTIIQKYKVNWGSYTHILAFLYMLRLALKDECTYFHILPANAFPVKSIEKMKEFYRENSDKNFLEISEVNSNQLLEDRQRYFYFQHLYNVRSDRGGAIQGRLLQLQKKCGIRRKVFLSYKGYLYCHISKAFAKYVFKYLKKYPNYIRKLKTMGISEEFFFQNIIMGSPYQNSLVCTHLIYDDWVTNNYQSPAVLTQQQIDEALISDRLFARKVETVEMADYIFGKIAYSE